MSHPRNGTERQRDAREHARSQTVQDLQLHAESWAFRARLQKHRLHRQPDRHTNTHRHTDTHAHTHADTNTHTDQTHRQTDRQTGRQADRQTHILSPSRSLSLSLLLQAMRGGLSPRPPGTPLLLELSRAGKAAESLHVQGVTFREDST